MPGTQQPQHVREVPPFALRGGNTALVQLLCDRMRRHPAEKALEDPPDCCCLSLNDLHPVLRIPVTA